jgi:electron transfer flavoprotein alpha subunit
MPNEIWVLAEHQDGKVRTVTFELLTAGAEFSKKTGQAVGVLLLGNNLQEAAKNLTPFADKIYLIEDPLLGPYISDTYLMSIVPLVREYEPSVLLGGAGSTGKDLFPRLAMQLQTGYVPDCTGLTMGQDGRLMAQRPLFGGKVFVEVGFSETRPQMATVRNNTFIVNENLNRSAEVFSIPCRIDPSALRKKVVGFEKASRGKARYYRGGSGGRCRQGIKGPERFKMIEDWPMCSTHPWAQPGLW